MEFIDDRIPEPEAESVEVMLTGDGTVQFEPASSITITIEDNDCKAP